MERFKDFLISKVTHTPALATSSINYTTKFITHVVMEEKTDSIYRELYSRVVTDCEEVGKVPIVSSAFKDLEKFFNEDPNNIIFLIESLTEKTAVCALEVYNLHYQNHNDKLLDYYDIESNSLLRKVYLENGADASAFALATAVYFFQNSEFEF